MDNVTKWRSKFWFAFFIFFVIWYLLLHNAKYQSSSPATTTEISFSNTTAAGDDETDRDSGDDDDIDWINDASQLRDLETELEPILEELKPLPEIKVPVTKPCSGRYIYVHDLPAKFNDDIVKDCRNIMKWQNMCPYVENYGMGPDLGNPRRMFSRSGWYSTNQFLLEVIFRNRMRQYDCLTNDSTIADAIYVPYYPGLDLSRNLFENVTTRDGVSIDLAKWLRDRPEWKPMSGRNHFLVAGRVTWDFRREIDDDKAWGNKLFLLPELKNMTVLSIEKSPWHWNDFAIPYPTYFHPSKDNEIIEWQHKVKKQRRRVLYSFAGAPRPNKDDSIRGEIIEQCIASKRKCKLLSCSDGNPKCNDPVSVMKLFQSSSFCLQPPGDTPTRRSTFDAILAGCIPVFFTPGSAYIQYLWHFPRKFEKYSVLINEEDVKSKNVSIERVLSRIPRNKVSEMREEVIGLIPKVVYANPKSKLERFEDAFDLSVKGVAERMEKLRNNASSFDFDETASWKYHLFGTVHKHHEWDHYFRNGGNQKVKKESREGKLKR